MIITAEWTSERESYGALWLLTEVVHGFDAVLVGRLEPQPDALVDT